MADDDQQNPGILSEIGSGISKLLPYALPVALGAAMGGPIGGLAGLASAQGGAAQLGIEQQRLQAQERHQEALENIALGRNAIGQEGADIKQQHEQAWEGFQQETAADRQTMDDLHKKQVDLQHQIAIAKLTNDKTRLGILQQNLNQTQQKLGLIAYGLAQKGAQYQTTTGYSIGDELGVTDKEGYYKQALADLAGQLSQTLGVPVGPPPDSSDAGTPTASSPAPAAPSTPSAKLRASGKGVAASSSVPKQYWGKTVEIGGSRYTVSPDGKTVTPVS